MSAHSESERHRIHDVQEYGVDCLNFMVYLQSVEEDFGSEEPGVEYRMANRLIKNLDILSGIDPRAPITVSMKTGGGEWAEGMAMFDAIIATPNPVSILNYAEASSMSSIILQAANKRIMMPHSNFMYHEGSCEVGGTAKQMRSAAEFSKIADAQMIKVYVEALKRSEGKIRSWSKKRIKEHLIQQMNEKEEVYLTAEDAVKLGFADEMFTDWHNVTVYTEAQLARK